MKIIFIMLTAAVTLGAAEMNDVKPNVPISNVTTGNSESDEAYVNELKAFIGKIYPLEKLRETFSIPNAIETGKNNGLIGKDFVASEMQIDSFKDEMAKYLTGKMAASTKRIIQKYMSQEELAEVNKMPMEELRKLNSTTIFGKKIILSCQEIHKSFEKMPKDSVITMLKMIDADGEQMWRSMKTDDIFSLSRECSVYFEGGERALDEFIKVNVKYPEACKENNTEGEVYTTFIIEKDGSVTNPGIVSSPSEEMSKEALRVCGVLPKWNPAGKSGIKARRRIIMPIIFDSKTQTADLAYETNAQFPGGDEAAMLWLRDHIRYPKKCHEKGIQGRVLISWVVERDGSLVDIKVVRSPDEALSKEALRVVQEMPKWIPAMQNGKPVRSRFTFPIMFRLG